MQVFQLFSLSKRAQSGQTFLRLFLFLEIAHKQGVCGFTRQDNGTLRLNFKPMKVGADFSVERYAFGVYRELHKALEGLVEESETLR